MKNVLAMVGNGVCGVTYADMRTGKASVSIQLPLTYYAKGFESPTPHQTVAGNCGGLDRHRTAGQDCGNGCDREADKQDSVLVLLPFG